MPNVFELPEEKLAQLTKKLIDERDGAAKSSSRREREKIWAMARKQYQTGDALSSDGQPSLEKSDTLNGPLTAYRGEEKRQGSTVSVNITRPYTNAGTAQVANILLPTGKLPFKLELTAVSDLEALRGVLENYPQLVGMLETLAPEIAKKLQTPEDESKLALEAASKLIRDWLQETNWASVVRMQINESGKVGTGVIKGPFPKRRQVTKEINDLLDKLPTAFPQVEVGEMLSAELRTLLQYSPASECIKVENCYPDPECGSDHQNGKFFYERIPEVTRRQLEEHKTESGYNAEQLQACLDEGPKIFGAEKAKKDGPFEFWLRTGMLECEMDAGEKISYGFQVTTLCNDRIVKSEEFWLDSTKFPYWVLQWEPRENCWTGIGIPEQIETPQRGLNSSVRALMDNMGYSVGPQILEREGIIEPVDGNWQPYPYKRWKVLSDLPGVDATAEAKQALVFLEFPNYLNEIMPVISWWLQMAEQTTGLSLLLQGQAVTDAVGVNQQLMANATTNLRLVIKEWDDRTCHPLITAYYQWAQQYGPQTAKGDAVVMPLGSAALIVRELQQQALLQIGDKAVQPIFGLSPKKWMKLYLEGFQVDAEQLELDDDERKQLEEAAKEPDPKVVVAQIQAETDKYRAELKDAFDMLKLAVETEIKELAEGNKLNVAELSNQTKVFQTLTQQQGREGEASTPTQPTPPAQPAPIQVDQALDMLEEG